MNKIKIPSPVDLIDKFLSWFTKEKRRLFIFAFIIGLLAHIIVITNDIVSTDAILNGEVYLGGTWELSLGRWLTYFIGYTRFALVSSVVSGILSIIIVSFASILLTDLFCIKNKIFRFFVTMLIIISPFFTSTLMSTYCSLEFSMSYFLSIFSVYSLYKIKNKKVSYTLSIISLAFSLGIYQANLGVVCGLCLILPLIEILKEKITIEEFFKKILKFIIIGILSIILYEIILNILLILTNTKMSSYGGANEVGIKTFLEIPLQIKNAYINFYSYFFNDKITNNLFYRRNFLNVALFIIMLISIIKLLIFNKNKRVLLLTILILIILPLALGILTLIAPSRNMYSLMTAPYLLVYIFILTLIDDFNTKRIFNNLICWGTTLLMIILIITHLCMTNATYMSLRITKEKTLFASTKIVNDIYLTEGYEKDIKVLFIGRSIGNYFETSNKVYELSNNIGLYEPQMWEEPHLCNRGWNHFIKYYLGVEFLESSIEDYEKVISNKEYQEMPFYPRNGYIKIINDTLVVKITE